MENDKEVSQENEVAGEVGSGSAFAAMDETDSEKETSVTSEVSEEHAHTDYTTFSKKELVEVVKELARHDDVRKADAIMKEVKPVFDEMRAHEKSEALKRFKSEGGVEDDFEYRLDELDHAFDATVKLLRDKRNQFYKSQEEKKSDNLRKKNEVLDQLRLLIDGEDNPNSFHLFKDLQQQWKQVGPVPVSNIKTLWANYNALIDRFYDHRSIYFELKELDRKRNLEAKQDICVKAERLREVTSIKDAVRELNELHHEFKHIGPVPKEDQENVWQRFKKASDEVYARRDVFVADLHTELQKNLDVKTHLLTEIDTFVSFTTDRIKDWNHKTQEILELQKKWDAVGAVPRVKARDINKKFWSAFKSFFHHKGIFFKKLDEDRGNNLKAKQELVKRALEMKESEDWSKTTQELIELQKTWKEIGPVPEKQREKIYKEFKEACDFFFEHRRGSQEKADQEQTENLKKKEVVIEALLKGAGEKTGSLDILHQLQAQFNEIGFVPKNVMASIKNRHSEATTKYIESIGGLNAEEKDHYQLEAQLSGLRNDPQGERKIYHKEQSLRKQIMKAENDLAVLRNNLEFFGRSKNAEKLKGEFTGKIEEAEHHLVQLKSQLKLLKAV